jgi:hypothetical protein
MPTTILPIDPNTLNYQTISSNDTVLLDSFEVVSLFDPTKDIVEYFIYDFNDSLIYSNSNFRDWTNTEDPSLASTTLQTNLTGSNLDYVPSPQIAKISTINLDPIQNVQNVGFGFGKIKTLYNFLSYELSSSPTNQLFISDISSDRTELRLKTNFISDAALSISYEAFKTKIDNDPSFDEFYLNFGNNQLVVAVNILLDNTQNPNSILIKLYEPLPLNFTLKNTCFIVTKTGESVAYSINFEEVLNFIIPSIPIQGPNFNLSTLDQISPASVYQSYQDITATPLSGSYYQLLSNLTSSGVYINVDYSDYSNFVQFSSAAQRLDNFKEKLTTISSSQAELNILYAEITGSTTLLTPSVSSSKATLESTIQSTITSFDDYEYFLYFESSSTTWPKSNNTIPYTLYDVNSATGVTWYNSQSNIAQTYDAYNQNYIYYAIPEYIRDDSQNDNYILFSELVSQLFDNIWVYEKSITDKLDSNPNLNIGVSPALVADVIQSLGIKLYSSNFTTQNIYNSLLGFSPSGSILLPTGSKLVTNYVTASVSSSVVPTIQQYHQLTYKKIYHSLPYLLKRKGTLQGLRSLINIFGISDTILRINEFGGKDKNINTWDNWQNEFNYTFYTSGSAYVTSSFILNSSWGANNDVPQAVEFRFKTDGLPQNTSSIVSQSLWITDQNVNIRLRYTGSGYTSGSYSGSIPDTYNEYALLEFIPDLSTPATSASIYLPFYNEGWWSVLVNKNGTNYTLYSANKNYEGNDGNTLAFEASSSITSAATTWNNSTISTFASASYKIFTGSLQEIRYYTQPISKNSFDAYVMNPYSIEQNEYLAFRATLGGELYTSSLSVHPKITGSWVTTSSFIGNSIFFTSSGGNYAVNREVIYFDQFAVGIQNAISDKITNQRVLLPYSDNNLNNIPSNKVLSAFNTIQQSYPISQSYTNDVNYLEVAFSPQNEINEDINSSIGFFNIGELIGDPRQLTSSADTYPDLDALRDAYFEKYTGNYDWIDFINIISYYDNSLFKMIADFVPAKSGLASGIVIKQSILERNKYPQPQVDTFTTTSYYGSGSQPDIHWNSPLAFQNITYSGSILTTFITGSSGGSVPNLGGQTQSLGPGFNIIPITQSWSGSNTSLSGSIPYIDSFQTEFFNGEFSGSNLVVTDGILSDCNVEIIEVYTTGAVGNVSRLVDGVPTSPFINTAFYYNNKLDFDVNVDNSYYISFNMVTNVDDDIGGTAVAQLKDNSGKVFYTSPEFNPGESVSIDKLQINNPFYPLYFYIDVDVYDLGVQVQNILLYQDQLNDLDGDCEPLLNNILINRPNPYYMDVDFSTNPYIAVNQQSILTGSATRFAIPQSDYTTIKHAGPRYFGSRTIAPSFGQAIYKDPAQLPFKDKSQVLGLTDLYQNLRDGTLDTSSLFTTGSQVPNVENYTKYFCYFNTITDSSPEYPSGSNLNLFYIIDENGRSYGLSNQSSDSQQINDYLYIISNLYPSNSKPYIIPISGSNVSVSNLLNNFPVIEGGARYQTIFAKTGSGGNFQAFWSGSNTSPVYVTYFHSQSISTFNDTGSITNYKPWLYPLLTFTDPISGSINEYTFNFLNVYNPNTNETIITGSNIYPINTLFPLQDFDFIRIANTGSSVSSSLDGTFTALGLYQIKDIFTGSAVPVQTSSLSIVPFMNNTTAVATATGGNPDYQRFRVFRRIPTQTNVLIGIPIPDLTEGFLIPENYNPNLNPIDLAKIAGII